MDRNYIEANHIIERYLAGQLTAEQAEEFEVYCLENPEMADDLEYARALKEELTTTSQNKASNAGASKPFGWLTYLAGATAVLVTGIALLVASTSWRELQLLREQVADLRQPFPIMASIILEAQRGTTIPSYSLPSTGGIEIRIDVGPNSAPSYKVTLTRQGTGKLDYAAR